MKKSYKLLVLWFVIFCVAITGVGIISDYIFKDIDMDIKIIDLSISVMLTLLFIIIYKTESVYWINGIEYEDAVKATSQQRKILASKYVKMFSAVTIILLIYTIIGILIKTSWIIDILIFAVMICSAAIYSIKTKL